jgi:WD40 repeat protein
MGCGISQPSVHQDSAYQDRTHLENIIHLENIEGQKINLAKFDIESDIENIATEDATTHVVSKEYTTGQDSPAPNRIDTAKVLAIGCLERKRVDKYLKSIQLVKPFIMSSQNKTSKISDFGCQYLVAEKEGSYVIYRAQDQSQLLSLEPEKITATSLTLNRTASDMLSLIVGYSNGAISRYIIDADNRSKYHSERYYAHGLAVSSLTTSHDQRLFFSGDWDGQIFVWLPYDFDDAYQGGYDRVLSELKNTVFVDGATRLQLRLADSERIDQILLSDDMQYLFVLISQRYFEIWQIRGAKQLAKIELSDRGSIRKILINNKLDRFLTFSRVSTLEEYSLEFKENLDPILGNTFEYEMKSLKKIENFSGEPLFFLDDRTIIVNHNDGELSSKKVQ